jgi:hypothetical protein
VVALLGDNAPSGEFNGFEGDHVVRFDNTFSYQTLELSSCKFAIPPNQRCFNPRTTASDMASNTVQSVVRNRRVVSHDSLLTRPSVYEAQDGVGWSRSGAEQLSYKPGTARVR